MVRPHDLFQSYTPDEVAETWDGVGDVGGLYEALWVAVNEYEPFEKGECPGEVENPNTVARFWGSFGRSHQLELNRLAERHYEEYYKVGGS